MTLFNKILIQMNHLLGFVVEIVINICKKSVVSACLIDYLYNCMCDIEKTHKSYFGFTFPR